MELRDNYFGSNVCLSIPMNTGDGATIHNIQSDISIEILDNYIFKHKEVMEILNNKAMIELIGCVFRMA